MKHTLLAKLLALGVVLLLLVFGLGLIESVVHDRMRYRAEATRSVSDSLAGSQTLLGPVIHAACTESWDVTEGSGDARTTTEQRREFRLTALPGTLNARATAVMDERARGIHTVNTYALRARISAQWDDLAALQPERTQPNSRLQCGAPIAMLAVADARGIRNAALTLDGQAQPLKAGTFHPRYPRGLHASLPDAVRSTGQPVVLELDLELVGTERLALVPLGNANDVQLTSTWPHPSFEGRFLPTERSVGDDGFQASWRLSALATTAAQDVAAGRPVCGAANDAVGDAALPAISGCTDSFGVAFIDPVNAYTLADRATKYGLLFIGLTFIAVGLVEILRRLRVHPVQYLLVGAAMAIFFLLLISLSEHLGFAAAYGVAAGACVLLIGYYAASVLGHWRRGALFGLGIALLYALLYGLLRLEQTALAVGSVALFAVLAGVMAATRRIDWYALGRRD